MIWHNILEILGYILVTFIIALTMGAIVTIVAGVINDARRKKASKKYTIDIDVVREDIRRMDGSGGKRG